MPLKDIPELRGENARDALLNFYEDLGWDRKKKLDPRKVKMNEKDWGELLNNLLKFKPKDYLGVSFLLMNQGPSGDDTVPSGKVLWEESSDEVSDECLIALRAASEVIGEKCKLPRK